MLLIILNNLGVLQTNGTKQSYHMIVLVYVCQVFKTKYIAKLGTKR